MHKHRKNSVISDISIFLIVFIFIAIFNITKVSAEQPPWDETNVSGWSWSGISGQSGISHIGWFSNNCYNYFSTTMESRCGSDYGVRVDPVTGNLSGYSWNGVLDDSGAVTGIGWLDYNPQPFPAPPYYEARVEPEGSTYEGQVSGWVRIKSIKEAGEYLGYEDWGWVLMGPEPGTNRQFGVEINFSTSLVTGYAWAGGYLTDSQLPPNPYENITTGLGWISFDSDIPYINPHLIGSELHGYAWMGNIDNIDLNFEANGGWIALNCKTAGINGADICATSDFEVTVDSSTGEMGGYAWIGEAGDTGSPIGWINFDPNPYPESPNYSAKVFLEDSPVDSYGTYQRGDVVGWARFVALEKEGAKGHFENWGWVKLHATDIDTSTYGVSMDMDTGVFDGHAWSGGGTVCVGNMCYDNNVGLGWISFQDYGGINLLPPTYVAPFLETIQGDIYSKTSIGSSDIINLPTNYLTSDLFYNSSFLIQTGGTIERYTSESGLDYLREGYSELIPPLATNKYTNVMGKLDIDGITSYETSGTPPVNTNKFGNIVDFFSGNAAYFPGNTSNVWTAGYAKLEGKIYSVEADLNVDTPLVIASGNNINNENASGTIVIGGDLYINNNITYEPLDVNDTELKDIPSIIWIVKGNVYISPNVTEVAGNFVVVGKETGGVLDGGTGEFYTGAGEENLVISGLVVAHEMFLQRSGIGTVENIQAAERIFYDGRIILNTPPGVGDFAGALPTVGEIAPIEVGT